MVYTDYTCPPGQFSSKDTEILIPTWTPVEKNSDKKCKIIT